MPPRKHRPHTSKQSKPEKRNGPVEVRRPKITDQLHPTIAAAALQHAGGDASRIEAQSRTHAVVTIT